MAPLRLAGGALGLPGPPGTQCCSPRSWNFATQPLPLLNALMPPDPSRRLGIEATGQDGSGASEMPRPRSAGSGSARRPASPAVRAARPSAASSADARRARAWSARARDRAQASSPAPGPRGDLGEVEDLDVFLCVGPLTGTQDGPLGGPGTGRRREPARCPLPGTRSARGAQDGAVPSAIARPRSRRGILCGQ